MNIQTNSFSEIDTSGIIMFPLSMGETSKDRSSLSYKDIPSNNYWNIIFYNSHTRDYHLLSESKMLVKSFSISSDAEEQGSQAAKYIFYAITIEDHDKDKWLTPEDSEYLFVSDKAGKNFRQISPRDYSVQSWQLVKSSNKVLMTLTKDSDNDKKFGDKDEVVTFEINIDTAAAPEEIFSVQFKNKLKILFDRDWKRIKK